MKTHFPETVWEPVTPEQARFSTAKLSAVKSWLHHIAGGCCWRVAVVRDGLLAAEWGEGLDRTAQLSQASIDKSLISSLLGIALEEKKIDGLDNRVIEYYPEMLAIRPGEGPKAGRYAFEKDREITFRQLISQTSGYMKPDEKPGEVFHYQTFGINIIANALATVYGLYDSGAPDRLPGYRQLLDERIRNPIGADWDSIRFNFDHPQGAKVSIFGNGCSIMATALDMARVGLLWLNGGRWGNQQLIPSAYLRQATKTNADVLAIEAEDGWNYGYGFWTNDHGKLWPDLPRDAFCASGYGAMHIFVCPSLNLVVSQTPGPWDDTEKRQRQSELLARLVDALQD